MELKISAIDNMKNNLRQEFKNNSKRRRVLKELISGKIKQEIKLAFYKDIYERSKYEN